MGTIFFEATHMVFDTLALKPRKNQASQHFFALKCTLFMSSLLFLLSWDVTRSLLEALEIFMFVPNYLFRKMFLVFPFKPIYLNLPDYSNLYFPSLLKLPSILACLESVLFDF